MPDPRHAQAKAIFLAARERPPSERDTFVDEACAGDPGLLRDVRELLAYAVDAKPEAAVENDTEPMARFSAAVADWYRIEGLLGQGGMARVYLARDLKHDRRVAVKVLSPEVAMAIGRERFLSEVRLTARLNHPHVLPLLDSGEAEGILYYVMPFVEGKSLRDRLAREGALPVDATVSVAAAVASALDHAHRHQVTHRDIKPENILMRDGQPVLADFGIALPAPAAGKTRLTETGYRVGTPQYMSPEQAMADPAIDGRSDIYSLGCVTYEMLTGRPPTQAVTTPRGGGHGTDDEPFRVLTQRFEVPVHVASAVHVALAVSPADRFASAAQMAAALTDPSFGLPASPTRVGKARADRTTMLLGGLVALLVVIAGWGWFRPIPTFESPTRYVLTLPVEGRLDLSGNGSAIALSPEGATLVYVGPGTQLWRRSRERLDPQPISGTQRAVVPFFAPAGDRVGFFDASFGDRSRAALYLSPLQDGPPQLVTDSGVGAAGGAWSDDGFIYFDSFESEIVRIHEDGGARERITALDRDAGERGHRWPDVLPGGDGLLLTVVREAAPRDWTIDAVDLATGTRRSVVPGLMARYTRSGHLLYVAADGTLLAAPFDPDRLEVTGTPTALANGVGTPVPSLAVSESGRLIYVMASERTSLDQVVWVDRDGGESPVDARWFGDFTSVTVDPAGDRLAVNTVEGGEEHIWVKAIAADAPFKLTLDGAINRRPSWASDGASIVFVTDADARGTRSIVRKPADGAGAAVPLAQRPGSVEAVVSPDGRWLVFTEERADQPVGNLDILAAPIDAPGDPVPLARSTFEERSPALSPDGRWLAYVSTRDGRPQVYVQPFPDAGGALWQVSTEGGQEPVWARTRRELYFRSGDNLMVAAAFDAGPTFAVTAYTELFSTSAYRASSFHRAYDVGPDDRRFAMIRYGWRNAPDLVVVENFVADLVTRATP